MPLLWYLRDVLGMTGTKFGCGPALCGACTVHLDGSAVRVPDPGLRRRRPPHHDHRGAEPDGNHPVQVAWRELNVPNAAIARPARSCRRRRCCKDTPKPSDDQIDAVMAGNICRCGTYQRIRAAIKLAAGNRQRPREA